MSNTVTIYRFENHKGEGPFSGNATGVYNKEQRVDKWHSIGDMPSLWSFEDMDTPAGARHRSGDTTGLHYGFTSKAQLKRSIRSARGRREMCRQTNQRLTVWEVPANEVLKGHTQCVFKRSKGKIVGLLDAETLKEIALT